jgi:hypothetical protein
MSKGQSNKQIARELNIALGSVKVHASALFSKLGIRNRTQAAMRYAQSIPYQRGGLGQATSPSPGPWLARRAQVTKVARRAHGAQGRIS